MILKYVLCLALCCAFSPFVFLASPAEDKSTSRREEDTSRGDKIQIEMHDEIVVTAQKREQRLVEVPGSVSVLNEEDLERRAIKTTSDVSLQVPNLEIKSILGASNPTVFLRGVGLNDFNPNASGAVGFYSDGVYLGAPASQIMQIFDLERIEILHGPQGTLFGRNTTGGAINLVTRAPSGTHHHYSRLGLGRFDQMSYEGGLDLPLPGDRNGLRLALVTEHRDGHTRNRFNGELENDIGSTAARLRARFHPADNLSLNTTIRAGRNRAGARSFQSRGLIDGADALGYVESPDPFEGSYNLEPVEDIDSFGASVSFDWTSPRLSIVSITAYEETERSTLVDDDASPNRLVEFAGFDVARQLSQEIRVRSEDPEEPFSWLTGAYFIADKIEVENSIDVLRELRSLGRGFDPRNGIFLIQQSYLQESESFAIFGQTDFKVGPKWSLSLGLRHTWEDKEINFNTAFTEPLFSVPLIDTTRSLRSNDFSGSFDILYAPKDNIVFFAGLRRGFKSGGFNGGALFSLDELTTVKPETVTSLEVGTRASWLNRRLQLNAALFAYDYQNLQVFNFVNTGGVPSEFLDNAATASVEGVELELKAQLTEGLEVTLAAGLLDARYDDFLRGNGTNLSGNRLISAPEWSYGVSVAYSWRINGSHFTAFMDLSSRDDVFLDSSNSPLVASESYSLANGRLSFESPSERYAVALWTKNLTDEIYLVDIFDFSDFGFQALVMGDPNTYGIDFTIRF